MHTLKQVAENLGLPESTLRLYRDEFEEWVPADGEGRRRRYGTEGVDALRRVVEGKRAGWSSARLREELARETRPPAKARRRNTDERLDELNARLQAQSGEIGALRVEVASLRGEITRLCDLLRQQPLSMEDALGR